MQRLRGLAISWFFAPYVGSADIDFFKRIKDTDIDYTVMQLKRQVRDDRLMEYATRAGLDRIEVSTDFNNPRARHTRDEFEAACVYNFQKFGHNYDFIISHSNEIPSHAAALRLKKEHPKVPWVAYFGDLFQANPYLRYIPNYPLVDEDSQTELETLKHADVVILNNEHQKQLMFAGDMAKYACKAVVIPHCFDRNMYPAHRSQREGVMRFVHLGTLYHAKRTAEPLLKAVDRLVSIYPEYKGRFEVLFYGSSVCSHDISVHAFMKNRNMVRFEDPVPYVDSLRIMCESDVLLLIDGIFNKKEDGIDVNPFLAGKLADYMGARKPIMAITMDKGPSADILKASGNLVADERIDRIAYVLKRYVDGKVAPDLSKYDDYDCSIVTKAMENAIRRAIQ